MIACDEIVSVMGIVTTKMTRNVTNSYSVNCHFKKVKHCYILHTVLLAIILSLIITVICHHYVKQKASMHWQYKIENNEFKKVYIKNRTCFYFDDIIKLDDFDIDNFCNRWKITRKYFDLWNFI